MAKVETERAKVNKKRPRKKYVLSDWDFRIVKSSLQERATKLRNSFRDEELQPSVRAMCGAEADEVQEVLDDIRKQDEGQ